MFNAQASPWWMMSTVLVKLSQLMRIETAAAESGATFTTMDMNEYYDRHDCIAQCVRTLTVADLLCAAGFGGVTMCVKEKGRPADA